MIGSTRLCEWRSNELIQAMLCCSLSTINPYQYLEMNVIKKVPKLLHSPFFTFYFITIQLCNATLDNNATVGQQILLLWSSLIKLEQMIMKSQRGAHTFACHCVSFRRRLLESSSFLLGILRLMLLELRLYRPLSLKEERASGRDWWEGRTTAVPLPLPGTTSRSPTQPIRCTWSLPER